MAREKKEPARKTGVAAWNEDAGIKTRAMASGTSRRSRVAADRRRRKACLVALLVACVACLVCAWPINERIVRGLWLKGGTAYTMDVAQQDGSKPTAEQMSEAISRVQARLAASGVSEYHVQQQGDSSFVIDLPDTIDGEGVAKIVGGTGLVELVRVDEIGDADALVKINAGTENVEMDRGTYESFLDNSSVASASVESSGSDSYSVHIVFDDEGATTFADVTRELAEDYGSIAIVIDGRVNSTPSVSEEISGGEVYISGDFTSEEANALKAALDGDALDLDITYVGSKKVGPLVGKTLLWGMVGVACLAFVGITVLAYRHQRKLSLLVAGTMAVYGVFMLGLMALASRLDMFVLTIPGVVGGICAAALATVSTWLVTGRFQAMVHDGRTLRGASTSAPGEGLRPVRYPCIIAGAVSCVLLLVPMASLREFGLTVVFGIICGIVAVCWFAITSLRVLAVGAIQKAPAAWGLDMQQDAAPNASEES